MVSQTETTFNLKLMQIMKTESDNAYLKLVLYLFWTTKKLTDIHSSRALNYRIINNILPNS